MTVAENSGRIKAACNGILSSFPFTMGIADSGDIRVILSDSDGNESTLVEGVNYYVSCVNDCHSGGTVVTTETDGSTLKAYAAGYHITIAFDVPLSQESDFTEGMATLYEVFEQQLDKQMRAIQMLREELNRCLTLPISQYSSNPFSLPAVSANALLGWNSAGTNLANFSTATVTIPQIDHIGNYGDDLAAAVAAIGSNPKTLLINYAIPLAGSSVITPTTLTLWFTDGGRVDGTGVETLTINGGIMANPWHRWIGDNLTLAGTPRVDAVWPDWHTENTTPGTTDMSAAIQWVLTNSNKLSLVPGQTYNTTVPITSQKANITIEGNGATLTGTDVSGYILDLGNQASPTVGLEIDNLKIAALGTTTGALRISDISNFSVKNFRFTPTGIGALIRGGCYLGIFDGGRIENQTSGLDTAVKIEASTSGAKPNGMKLSNVWMAGTSKAGSKGFWDSAGGGAGMRSDNCYYEDFADNGVLVESGYNFESIGDSFEGNTIGIQVDTNKPTILYPMISGGTTGMKVSGTSATLKYVSGPVDPSSEYAYIVDGASASIDTDSPAKVTIENPDNSINFNSTTRNFYPTKYTADTQLGFYHFSPGWVHNNKGALSIITLTLPVIDNDSEYGMGSTFTRYNATYAMRLDPGAGTIYLDGVSLGAGKYASFDTNLATVKVQSIAAGIWAMTTLNGTVTGEP